MRDLAELNINKGGRPVCRAPPTAGEIEAFQSSFGITLPPDYLALLMYVNGGHPELSTHVPPGLTPRESNWAVDDFYFLNQDRESVMGLWSATAHWRTILGMWALPIAADGGGNQFFLDLSEVYRPVKVCIH